MACSTRGPIRRPARSEQGPRVLRSALLALASTLAAAAPAAAQSHTWFPAQRRFAPLVADPREVRLAGSLGVTDVLDPGKAPRERPAFAVVDPDDFRRDFEAFVALGGTVLLWGASDSPDRGIVLGAQAGVFARFRVEKPSRDYLASDWIVAFPVEWQNGRLSGRARILHRSSHLGDEFIFETGARRIEFGHEAIDMLLAYRALPELRFYGGGAWIFRSNTENEPNLRQLGHDIHDDFTLQAGVDGEWWFRAEQPRLSLVAGIDAQAAQRTEWRPQIAAAAGIGARGAPGARGGLRILLRYFTGPSTLGEFFLTDESFWTLEAVVTRNIALAGPRIP